MEKEKRAKKRRMGLVASEVGSWSATTAPSCKRKRVECSMEIISISTTPMGLITLNPSVDPVLAITPESYSTFGTLMPCSFRLCLLRLLPVAPYHDNREEAANNSTSEQDQNDWYADCPNSRWEEGLRRMRWVNEWLAERVSDSASESVYKAACLP